MAAPANDAAASASDLDLGLDLYLDLGAELAGGEESTGRPAGEEAGGGATTVVWHHGFGLRLLVPSRATPPPPPTPPPRSAVVVGAGIVGCAVALELARRGLQVTVIDQRDEPAAPAPAPAPGPAPAPASAPPPEPSESSGSSVAPPSLSSPPAERAEARCSEAQCPEERCVDATSGSFAWLNANGKDSISASYGALNRLGMRIACRSWARRKPRAPREASACAPCSPMRGLLASLALRASSPASPCRRAPSVPQGGAAVAQGASPSWPFPPTATVHRAGLAMWRRVPPYAALACWGEGALLASTAAAGEDAGGAYAVAHDLGEAEVARLEPLLDAAGGRSAAEGGGAGGGGASGGGAGGGGAGGGGGLGASARRSHHLHHYPDEGSVCPRAASAALCEAARVEGASFLWGTAVTSLLTESSASATGATGARAIGVRAADGQGVISEVRADVVVLAAGVGLGTRALGASVPMLHSPGRLAHLAPRTPAAATAASAAAAVVASAAGDGASTRGARRLRTLFVDTLVRVRVRLG